jgi:hypothetical protein
MESGMSQPEQGSLSATVRRPRERGLKPERRAGSAVVAERSGAALNLSNARFGNAQVAGRSTSQPPDQLETMRRMSAGSGMVIRLLAVDAPGHSLSGQLAR